MNSHLYVGKNLSNQNLNNLQGLDYQMNHETKRTQVLNSRFYSNLIMMKYMIYMDKSFT